MAGQSKSKIDAAKFYEDLVRERREISHKDRAEIAQLLRTDSIVKALAMLAQESEGYKDRILHADFSDPQKVAEISREQGRAVGTRRAIDLLVDIANGEV